MQAEESMASKTIVTYVAIIFSRNLGNWRLYILNALVSDVWRRDFVWFRKLKRSGAKIYTQRSGFQLEHMQSAKF